MKVIVTYTDAPRTRVEYECKNEAKAREFADEELRWENTIKVEIPEIAFSESGDFATKSK